VGIGEHSGKIIDKCHQKEQEQKLNDGKGIKGKIKKKKKKSLRSQRPCPQAQNHQSEQKEKRKLKGYKIHLQPEIIFFLFRVLLSEKQAK